jgi:hypothetical protein
MTGADMITAERERQIAVEGWSAEHDDRHADGQMALAAVCYAAPCPIYVKTDIDDGFHFHDAWPWDLEWDKRHKHTRLRQLAIAGALIAAEIDRLLRAAPRDEEA